MGLVKYDIKGLNSSFQISTSYIPDVNTEKKNRKIINT